MHAEGVTQLDLFDLFPSAVTTGAQVQVVPEAMVVCAPKAVEMGAEELLLPPHFFAYPEGGVYRALGVSSLGSGRIDQVLEHGGRAFVVMSIGARKAELAEWAAGYELVDANRYVPAPDGASIYDGVRVSDGRCEWVVTGARIRFLPDE